MTALGLYLLIIGPVVDTVYHVLSRCRLVGRAFIPLTLSDAGRSSTFNAHYPYCRHRNSQLKDVLLMKERCYDIMLRR